MANGLALVKHSEVIDDIKPFCEQHMVNITTKEQYGHDLYGDPVEYTAVLRKGDKKIGLLVRSQTKRGTTEKKIFERALALQRNNSFKTLLVLVGEGWSKRTIAAVGGITHTVRSGDVIETLRGYIL